MASHVRTAPGAFARPPGQDGTGLTSSQQAFLHTLLGRCERVGPALHAWAVEAISERGVRALRLIQGVLQLTRRHPREAVLHAARLARAHRLFRYKDLQRLTDQGAPPLELELLSDHPAIRSMDAYRLEEFV
jgi:hypothetical protein